MRWIIQAGVGVGVGIWLLLGLLHGYGILRSDLGGRLMMLTMFIHVVGLIVAMVGLRGRENAIGFPRLLAAGMAVSLIAGLLSGLGWWIFLAYVDPSHLDWVRTTSHQQIAAAADLDEAQKQAYLAQIDGVTAGTYALRDALGAAARGFVFSVMLAAVLRMRVLRAGREASA
jgi:hypothetical protein